MFALLRYLAPVITTLISILLLAFIGVIIHAYAKRGDTGIAVVLGLCLIVPAIAVAWSHFHEKRRDAIFKKDEPDQN